MRWPNQMGTRDFGGKRNARSQKRSIGSWMHVVHPVCLQSRARFLVLRFGKSLIGVVICSQVEPIHSVYFTVDVPDLAGFSSARYSGSHFGFHGTPCVKMWQRRTQVKMPIALYLKWTDLGAAARLVL